MEEWKSCARWIWLPASSAVNQYGEFRQMFSLPENPGRVVLHISADSRYVAFVNGQYVPASQYADYPTYKIYDTVDITGWVHAGDNVLGIIGYFQGEDSSVYRLGRAGLLFAVVSQGETVQWSCRDTLCRISREYVSGEMERFSQQLSFSFHYRAEKCDGWQQPDYVISKDWKPASICRYFQGR